MSTSPTCLANPGSAIVVRPLRCRAAVADSRRPTALTLHLYRHLFGGQLQQSKKANGRRAATRPMEATGAPFARAGGSPDVGGVTREPPNDVRCELEEALRLLPDRTVKVGHLEAVPESSHSDR